MIKYPSEVSADFCKEAKLSDSFLLLFTPTKYCLGLVHYWYRFLSGN